MTFPLPFPRSNVVGLQINILHLFIYFLFIVIIVIIIICTFLYNIIYVVNEGFLHLVNDHIHIMWVH